MDNQSSTGPDAIKAGSEVIKHVVVVKPLIPLTQNPLILTFGGGGVEHGFVFLGGGVSGYSFKFGRFWGHIRGARDIRGQWVPRERRHGASALEGSSRQ